MAWVGGARRLAVGDGTGGYGVMLAVVERARQKKALARRMPGLREAAAVDFTFAGDGHK
jgi:hypothetical protein